MTNELSIASTHNLDHDIYTSCQARERALNGAIIQANISESFEEYLEIFDEFYADEVEVNSETEEEPIHGKARVRSLIANFLVPLHVTAEVGGLSISIFQTAIPGDISDETHSAWTLDLLGVSGRTCTVTCGPSANGATHWWCTSITMTRTRTEAPLTSDDLSFDTANLS